MLKFIAVPLVFAGSLLWAASACSSDTNSAGSNTEGTGTAGPLVLRINLDNEVISPGVARFIFRALDEAEDRMAECLIITLDTPGGLLESTRQIVKRFLQTPVCVVVYVSPTGARAASAGVFITMAAHVAAMAPATTIGAARPVSIGGFSPLGPEPSDERRNDGIRFPGMRFGLVEEFSHRRLHFMPDEWDLLLRTTGDGRLLLVPEARSTAEIFAPALADFRTVLHFLREGCTAPPSRLGARDPQGVSSLQDALPPWGNFAYSHLIAQASAADELVNSTDDAGQPAGSPGADASTADGQEQTADKPRELTPAEEPSQGTSSAERKASDGSEQSGKKERAEKPASPMEEKVINDTVSWAQALARQRGRNADWAAKAVRESISVTADEAVANGVVDLVATDFDELLRLLDGRTVKLPQGEKVLRTKGARVETIEMWWGERLLSVISHPEVAFLLLIFGVYGIMYELFSPGWGVPGTVGVICLLLGLFGLSVLPVNYLGLALLLLAISLFVAEAFVTSFGLLTLAGVICMILGGLMLIESPPGFVDISVQVVVAVSVATALVVVLIVGAAIRAHRHRVLTGDESLQGRVVHAKTDFRFEDGHYVGKVFLDGEWWEAHSTAPVSQGESCRILRREGLTLWVEPTSASGTRPPQVS